MKCAAATSSRLACRRTPYQIRQLGEIARQPPRLDFGQQVGRRTSGRLVLEIEIRERLSGLVADTEARIVVLLDRSGWRETTGVIAAGSQREPLDLDR